MYATMAAAAPGQISFSAPDLNVSELRELTLAELEAVNGGGLFDYVIGGAGLGAAAGGGGGAAGAVAGASLRGAFHGFRIGLAGGLGGAIIGAAVGGAIGFAAYHVVN